MSDQLGHGGSSNGVVPNVSPSPYLASSKAHVLRLMERFGFALLPARSYLTPEAAAAVENLRAHGPQIINCPALTTNHFPRIYGSVADAARIHTRDEVSVEIPLRTEILRARQELQSMCLEVVEACMGSDAQSCEAEESRRDGRAADLDPTGCSFLKVLHYRGQTRPVNIPPHMGQPGAVQLFGPMVAPAASSAPRAGFVANVKRFAAWPLEWVKRKMLFFSANNTPTNNSAANTAALAVDMGAHFDTGIVTAIVCGTTKGLEAWIPTSLSRSSPGGSPSSAGEWVSIEDEARKCSSDLVVVVMAGNKLGIIARRRRFPRLWHRVVREQSLPERVSVAFMLDTSTASATR